MSADILREIIAAGVELAIGETGNLKVTGDRIEVERWLPKIRDHKPALLALLPRPANTPAPPHLWRVTTPEGEVFSLSRTPPATLAEIEADYPGCTVEIEVEPPVGAALQPEDLALAYTDIGQEWIAGLARDPDRLKQMHAETVRLGLASYDPDPETDETAATGAVCALCLHWTPDRINPSAGLGRCREDAPASRRPGSLWPGRDAEIYCNQFDPKPNKGPRL